MMRMDALLKTAQYAIVLPGLLLFYLPLRGKFRVPGKRLLSLAALAAVLLCLAAEACNLWLFRVDTAAFSLFCGALAFAGCLRHTGVRWYKLLNVAMNAMALLTFTGLANVMVETRVNPHGDLGDVARLGLAVQWLLLAAVVALMTPILVRQYAWLIDAYDERRVWLLALAIPAIIALCNLMMIPREYSRMRIGRAFAIYLVMDAVLLVLLIVFNILFYRIARAGVERSALARRADLMAMQAREYEKLRAHMDQTSRLRHDYRQSLRTLAELADEGDLAEIRAYLSAYAAENGDRPVERYCENAAVNALLSYYASLAVSAGVRTDIRVVLPDVLPVGEVDLCNLLGNLLENAVDACLNLTPEKRRAALSVETDAQNAVYIVSTNSFDGAAKMRGSQYLSTKHSGEGLGLKSVRATADKYHGLLNVRHTGDEFCVDVLLLPSHPNDQVIIQG